MSGDTRIWTMDLSDCSRLLYHWAISPAVTVKLTSVRQWREMYSCVHSRYTLTACSFILETTVEQQWPESAEMRHETQYSRPVHWCHSDECHELSMFSHRHQFWVSPAVESGWVDGEVVQRGLGISCQPQGINVSVRILFSIYQQKWHLRIWVKRCKIECVK